MSFICEKHIYKSKFLKRLSLTLKRIIKLVKKKLKQRTDLKKEKKDVRSFLLLVFYCEKNSKNKDFLKEANK